MLEDVVLLYVEDDPTSRDIMDMLLSYGLGISHYTIFEDSHDFIARVEALSPYPDIILLDIQVDPYNGFDMLNMIRDHDQFWDIKVVALTASVMNEEVNMLKQAGFDGGIAKPISQDDFPDIIERILEGEKVWHIA